MTIYIYIYIHVYALFHELIVPRLLGAFPEAFSAWPGGSSCAKLGDLATQTVGCFFVSLLLGGFPSA